MARRDSGGIAARLRDWTGAATRKVCKLLVGFAVVVALALVLMDVARMIFGQGDFGVRERVVEGARMSTEEEILRLADVELGANIWLIRDKEVAKRIVQHPWIHSCLVAKVPPGKIWIQVEERQPSVACLHTESGKTFGINYSLHRDIDGAFLSEDAYVLPSFSVLLRDSSPYRREIATGMLSNLPLVVGHDAESFVAGEEIKGATRLRVAMRTFTELKETAPALAERVDVLDLSHPGEMVFFPQGGGSPMRISETRTRGVAARLAETWELLGKTNLQPQYIDARFPEIGMALQLRHVSDSKWLELCRRLGQPARF